MLSQTLFGQTDSIAPSLHCKNNRYFYGIFVGSPAVDRKTNGEKLLNRKGHISIQRILAVKMLQECGLHR
jgi:hypothetical protein